MPNVKLAAAALGVYPPTMADFGSDINMATGADGFLDLDPTGQMLPGQSALVVAQAVARRLQCPPGGLWTDPTYGVDLRETPNQTVTAGLVMALKQNIRARALQDERVDDVATTVNASTDGTMRIAVYGTTALGPFTLTLLAIDYLRVLSVTA